MSDRSALQLIIHDCPVEHAADVADRLPEWFDHVEWSEEIPADRVILRDQYTAEEATLGSDDEVAAFLEDQGCAFTVWQDPKYEFDGSMTCHVPGVGTWSGGADSDGNAHVTCNSVADILSAFGAIPAWVTLFPTTVVDGVEIPTDTMICEFAEVAKIVRRLHDLVGGQVRHTIEERWPMGTTERSEVLAPATADA